jgi:hypothetical protein
MAVFACESCRAIVSFGASECRECGLSYRYVGGEPVAEGDDVEEPERAPAPGPFRLPAAQDAEPSGHAPSSALVVAVALALAASASTSLFPLLAGLLVRVAPSGSGAPLDEIAYILTVVLRGAFVATNSVAAIVFLFWIHDASKSARSLENGLKYTPRAAVIWWFIPLASLIVPYRVMAELWKVSHARPGERWRTTDTSILMPIWWTLWLGTFVMDRIVDANEEPCSPSDLAPLAAAVVLTAAAVLAACIVVSIHRGLMRKARAVQSL